MFVTLVNVYEYKYHILWGKYICRSIIKTERVRKRGFCASLPLIESVKVIRPSSKLFPPPFERLGIHQARECMRANYHIEVTTRKEGPFSHQNDTELTLKMRSMLVLMSSWCGKGPPFLVASECTSRASNTKAYITIFVDLRLSLVSN